MLDYYEALQRILYHVSPLAADETVSLFALGGRVLAQDVLAQQDMPPFNHSAMDGFAINGVDKSVRQYRLVGQTAAGEAAAAALAPAEAIRIFTGAPIPAGTTAVVPQEMCEVVNAQLLLPPSLPSESFIRYQGQERRQGSVLLTSGQRLGPASIALLASQGLAQVLVRRRLRAAVFSSGNELVEPGMTLLPGQIHDSNRYQILAWLTSLGVDVTDKGILPDDLTETQQRLAQAANNQDVIVTTAGSSVGRTDYLTQALDRIGQLEAWQLAIKPGKPLAWGKIGNSSVFILPGNPVASFVTFHQLVLPALLKMAGDCGVYPVALAVKAAFTRPITQQRREFLRAVVHQTKDGLLAARPLPDQGSAMLTSCVAADGLLEIPPCQAVNEGELLTFYPLFGSGRICRDV